MLRPNETVIRAPMEEVAVAAPAPRKQGSTRISPVPPAMTPEERLSVMASMLATLMGRRDRLPARWRAPGFARQVDLVRGHLRPIRSRGSLALSYSREHVHVDPVGAPPVPLGLLRRSATEVAYAYRWLELAGEGRDAPWITLLDT